MVRLLDIKRRLVRTPLERPALAVQRALQYPKVLRHPGLRNIWAEEPAIKQTLRRLVQPTSNCVDIGCHIGSFLSQICTRAPQGRHVAFEPVPHKAAWIRAKFPEVQVHQCALAEQEGELTFYEDLDHPGFSSLSDEGHGGSSVREYKVAVSTLDKKLADFDVLTLVKIDVEGAELAVVKGGSGVLAKHRPAVIFESAPKGASRFGSTPGELYDHFVNEMDYQIFLFAEWLSAKAPLVRESFVAGHAYPFLAFNYLALPKEAGKA